SLALLGITAAAGLRCDLQQQLSLAITLAALIGYHEFVHDLSILFIPLAWLIGKKKPSGLLLAGLCFSTPSLLVFTPDHFYLTSLAVLALFVFLSTTSYGGPDYSTI